MGTAPGHTFRDTVTVVALPHAGASETVFQPWRSALPEGLRLHAVTRPGRGRRFGERPVLDVAAAVEDTLTQIAPITSPYAILGHSMGALLAYEVVLEVTRRRWPAPVALVVSGFDAPTHVTATPTRKARHLLADDELLEVVRDFGGTPAELLEPGVAEHFLPAIRADLSIIDTYRWEPNESLTVPILVLRGADDAATSSAGAAAWGDLTTGPVRERVMPGGHFFLYDAGVCAIVAADLARAADPSLARAGGLR